MLVQLIITYHVVIENKDREMSLRQSEIYKQL